MAVSDVVLNRVLSTKYPNTMCEVVRQGHKNSDGSMKRNKCQFSWYCDGKSDVPKDITSWERSRKYARDFYVHGAYVGITEGSTHYHANYTTPYWAPSFDRVTRIGSHIFYRMKGK
jgi:spore germination cell wall hydrolase CwlJ-like protein